MAKAEEYRAESVMELEAKLEEQRKGLFHLRAQRRQTGSFEKPHLVQATRREIARLLTVIAEKQKEEAK